MSKVNAAFDPSIKSGEPPKGLIFRPAEVKDMDAISSLMLERNPERNQEAVRKISENEILKNTTTEDYRIFIAEYEGRVVGFCRCYHSQTIPPEKIRYSGPEGWYCMGLMVSTQMRRRGIARFLFRNRLEYLKQVGVKVVYSMVACDNLASISMHQDFGYQEIDRAAGFLHIHFLDAQGVLYRRLV